MFQVYCDGETGINNWLKENHGTVEIIDIKMSISNEGEMIMVIYKTDQQ